MAGSTKTGDPAGARAGAARAAFVWGVWALMLLHALAFVVGYGGRVPFMDEWEIVPALAGEQEVTAAWLWSQHNEHRIPLPRLVLLGLHRLTGCDFRAGMYFNALALGALAFVMILTARAVRGRLSFTDAFFPLVLLHVGHAGNLLWSWQVAFILPTVLAGGLLVVIVRWGGRLTPGPAALAGTCLLLLPLCGAVGLALLPPLGGWLAYVGVLRCRRDAPPPRGGGLTLLAFVAAAVLLFGLYFIGYQDRPTFPDAPSPHLGVTLDAGVKVLALSLGPWARHTWPVSGLAAVGVVISGAAALLWRGWTDPGDRPRVLGLAAFLVGVLLLALAVGKARGGVAHLPWEGRYVTLMTLLWCWAYFAWGLQRPGAAGRFARGALILFVLLQLALNGWWWVNSSWWQGYRENMRAAEQDLLAGVPPGPFAERHGPFLLPYAPGALPDRVRMLQRAGCGPFRSLPADPG